MKPINLTISATDNLLAEVGKRFDAKPSNATESTLNNAAAEALQEGLIEVQKLTPNQVVQLDKLLFVLLRATAIKTAEGLLQADREAMARTRKALL